jgi:hypothetical protein
MRQINQEITEEVIYQETASSLLFCLLLLQGFTQGICADCYDAYGDD